MFAYLSTEACNVAAWIVSTGLQANTHQPKQPGKEKEGKARGGGLRDIPPSCMSQSHEEPEGKSVTLDALWSHHAWVTWSRAARRRDKKCHSTVWKPNVRTVSLFQFQVGNNWAPPNQRQHLCDWHIFWQDLLSNDDSWRRRPIGFTWGTQSWVPVLDGHRDATQDHMLCTGNAARRGRGAQCRFMFSAASHTR